MFRSSISGFSQDSGGGGKPSRKLTPKVDNESLIDLGKLSIWPSELSS